MKTHRLFPLTAALAAISLAVSVTGQSTQPAQSSQPGQSDQPRFNRPQTDSQASPARATDPAAPSTRPGTTAETDTRNTRRSGATELSRSDRNFFEKAAKSGQKEVAVSQAVLSQLTAPGCREFAETMIRDHTAANEELMALAQRKGADLTDIQTGRDQERLTRRWQDKNDDADKDYIKEMIDDHEEAVELFEKASKSEDPEIAAFAQKTLPKLQHHLEMARAQKESVSQRR
ncbi:MAG TPA: DUF4142 domain-containing protein [Opitutaceae bacterium]|nr:DUF4142 domain-containing protein [Opitutaceae bacterium]